MAGLPQQLPAFLAELAANNDRAWFTAHKSDFVTLVQEPLRHLVTALAPAMLDIDPQFDTNPKGSAVSRIHRDTRFSRDKAPYRISQWICFKRPGADWPSRPAFFLEIGPSGYRYGMGTYAAPPGVMKELRGRIAALPERFAAMVKAGLDAGFSVEGEAYARPKLPEGIPAEAEPWFRLKNAFMVANHPIEPALFSPGLADELAARWRAIAPLYRFLA